MSELTAGYRSRLVTHDELIAQFRPGNVISLGTWMGQPHGVSRRLGQLGPEIDPLYVSSSPASAHGEFLNLPHVRCLTTFLGPYERAAHRERRNVSFTPLQYTDAYKSVRTNRPPDYVIVRTAPMDERGYFNLSLACSWEYDAIHWYREHAPATRIVVEANPRMPRVYGLPSLGNNEISLADVSLIVEDDTPPPEYATPEPTVVDRQIAANVAALVDDRATIQLGIGTIPMVIGRLLADRKELGIHTELFCRSHLDLIEAGSVTNAHKGLHDGVSVATFALGDERLYGWLAENPAFAMLPVTEVNAVPVLARVRQMTSINSILTTDLSGQACAHCLGHQTYSGVGGAFEFAYGAQLSQGGKSILCLPSQTRLRDGREVSNIVARHPAGTRITFPEHCVDWVVTEFGEVRLKFLNLEWRAAALIEIAHPQYRDELCREAIAGGLDLPGLARLRRPPEHFFEQGELTAMNVRTSVMDLSALPVTHKTVIPEDYIDLMGHMNVMWYTHLFAKATGGIFQQVGLNREYFQANQAGTFALKQLFTYLVEVREAEEVTIRTRVLGRMAKKLHVMHFMTKGEPEVLASTNEFLAAHVDMKIRRTSPFPPSIAAAIDRLVAEHSALGWKAPVSGAMVP